MIGRTIFVSKIAKSLVFNGKTMTYDDLATQLNSNSFTTNRGTPYVGGRGVAKLVSTIYASLENEGKIGDAKDVAEAFTNAHGGYAYE